MGANKAIGKGLVYIVDDEPLLVEMANTILTNEGFDTRLFHCAEKVLEELRDTKQRPVLLITDCLMGGMDGIELIVEAKKLEPSLKTILLSGTVPESFVEIQHVKPDHFLPKPYQVKHLIQAINSVLA